MNSSEMAVRLRRHYEELGGAPATAADIYIEDALLEFMHTGERIRGKTNIDAAQRSYPGRPSSFEVHRVVCTNDVALVEMTLRFDGVEPHAVVAVLDIRDGLVVHERRYIAEPDQPAPYRAQWVETAARQDKLD